MYLKNIYIPLVPVPHEHTNQREPWEGRRGDCGKGEGVTVGRSADGTLFFLPLLFSRTTATVESTPPDSATATLFIITCTFRKSICTMHMYYVLYCAVHDVASLCHSLHTVSIQPLQQWLRLSLAGTHHNVVAHIFKCFCIL